MKKTLILLFLVIMGTSSFVNASDADLFNYDRESVDMAMLELSLIESYITENPGANYADVMSLGLLSINGKDFSNELLGYLGEPPLGIPSFLWGCVGGWVGLVVVYVATDNDQAEVKKALWGCVASTATVGVVYVIYAAAVLSATSL